MTKAHIKKTKAVIDIGTNSCRLFIGELEDGKITNKILKLMEITRLGQDVDKTGVLRKDAMDRTIETLKLYREKIDEYGIEEIKVTATSATRDSENREEFISRVKATTNFDIHCITGEEEGKLSFSGAVSEFDEKIMVFDIGGGSTEFILGDKNNIEYIESFNVGAVRLGEKFFKKKDNLLSGEVWVKEILKKLSKYKDRSFTLVGVAGTVTTHVSVLLGMEEYDTDRVHMYRLTKKEILKNLDTFLSKSLEERKKIAGLHPKRAGVIIPGTYLLLWIMEILERDEIIVSESDILEGMMMDD
ncbi:MULTISPECIES: Ppx/GppA phosphatase family protein [Psychrilyobacter]|uniref:Ppx/GppA family phosphatase n=1 Tax=Psychrilyobacter piezotolerans TaxID=2293438 RepID=A0ABX9KHZ9_9FUSO|nr:MULTISPECIES: Ppx/GppA phosphatase family protein [Psychrilyobacter]MCS5421448.1 Ppx/GppA family phosphatase [Psychrilyobacter sp. S5]NDI77800.1 Ppx/GppA family phosphatase [Psychrilyobacter piezotolerans]RDE62347.1 Ppx/GppA family phosphatase [Psychrilyobacter sp. S5]REI41445.1 Ppx/GppA family phosphatase [Psychrilyobacter piezotolerans]